MSDNKSAPLGLELVKKTINELAREVGMMEPDDPKLAHFLDELFYLTQLRRYLRLATDEPIGLRMDELAREMAALKTGDPRRAEVVQEIMRLSALYQAGE